MSSDIITAPVRKIWPATKSPENWIQAAETYAQAIALLPKEDTKARFKLELAKANARMYAGDLPEAITDMENLLIEMKREGAETKQLDETRSTLGSAQYYAAWLMRLEGAPREEWTIEVEKSRQNFRLLAEEAQKRDGPSAQEHQKNLEASIRLARMDLTELQGLPLPKQCSGCKNCSQRCRSQKKSRCQNPKPDKENKDARGASSGQRPDGSGS